MNTVQNKPIQKNGFHIDMNFTQFLIVLFMVFTMIILPIAIYENINPQNTTNTSTENGGSVAGIYTQSFYMRESYSNQSNQNEFVLDKNWFLVGGTITLICSILLLLILFTSFEEKKSKISHL